MATTARRLAFSCLIRVNKDKGYSNIVIDKLFAAAPLEPRDKAFAAALFYGVLERRITLHHQLEQYSSTALRKLSPPVLAALELGAYQLYFLGHLPASAVVNQSVELVKAAGQAKAGGLVNGVLRAIVRQGCKLQLPQHPQQAVLAVEFSVTPALAALLLQHYGAEDTRRFLQASFERPPLYIRVNTLRTTPQTLAARLQEAGAEATPHPAVPNCLALSHAGDVRNLPGFEEGLFHVQDAAAQLCALALGAKPGMQVADICAAPGGKSFTLAQEMHNTGCLTACELHKHRVGLIEQGAKRLGLGCIKAVQADATQPQTLPQGMDRVLCDVPCSGYGILRRKPEIRQKPPEAMAELPALQQTILTNAANCLKPGGLLLYATCTLNPAENSRVVQGFLQHNPSFTPAELPAPLCGCEATLLGKQFDSDGFYMAAIRRKA